MRTNTKALFISILKDQDADCVCDIGSRDGDQSRLFRHLLPGATVLAFEANPLNFKAMQAAPHLASERIELFPYAISSRRGTALFHVADVDYSDAQANKGTSSLLTAADHKIKSIIEVETFRIDEVILARSEEPHRVGLWIDVEGAEYEVLQGIVGIKDRVVAIHVETSNEPRWHGQKTLREVTAMLSQQGFCLCGRNFGDGKDEWGDVVFVREQTAREMGPRLSMCKVKAKASHILRADHIAVCLKGRFPRLYHALRRVYIRFGT